MRVIKEGSGAQRFCVFSFCGPDPLDYQSLVIHALVIIDAHAYAFGILAPSERSATLQQLAAASAGVSVPITSKADDEMKIEEAAAAGRDRRRAHNYKPFDPRHRPYA